MKRTTTSKRGSILPASLLLPAFTLTAPLHADELEQGFQSPPDSARPHTWWHWMNGNITKEGITADLEAMHRVDIGGAQIFNAAEGIPHGPIQFNSPEWRELVKFATLKAWPQCVLDGKPSPTGRHTFTTWHHRKKDDALLPSGLLGPVTLQSVTQVEAKE